MILQMHSDETGIYASGKNYVQVEEKLTRNLEKVSALNIYI